MLNFFILIFILLVSTFQLWFVKKTYPKDDDVEHIEKVIFLIKENNYKSNILILSMILLFVAVFSMLYIAVFM